MPRLLYRLASRAIPGGARIMRAQFNRLYLIAEAGAFVLTGKAVQFNIFKTLVAGTDSFTLTGQAVRLLRNLRLTAGAGAFTLAGQVVQRGYKIDAAAASFAVSGQAAGLLANRRMAAGAGAFTLTGRAVTLTYGSSGFPAPFWGWVLGDFDAVVTAKAPKSGRSAGIKLVFGD